MVDSGIIEIDKLRNSLNDAMCSQKTATNSMMVLKEQELQAQILALQFQMNPHFLYNSLTTIGAMAEDGQTEPIAQMCQDITSILRYISSNKEQVSSLEEKLEHCDVYLKCMKLRFGNSLQYEFDVDDDILANGLLPSLELDGMGILNIFIRFYLIYGITFIFDFGNLPEGGAIVKVGGRFNDETKPL